jgi:uncharacterized protein (TIGR02246 family)
MQQGRDAAPVDESEAQIRQLIREFVEAIRGSDLVGVLSLFTQDVVSFDFGPPLQHAGGEEFARRWRALFDAYTGHPEYDVNELQVTVDGDVAFTHSLNRIAGTLKSGRHSERWVRWTACFRRSGGRWRVVHEHVSVPADLQTGKALLDLKR